MPDIKPGTPVTVTSPIQPTGHRGGETGVITGPPNEHGVLPFQQDADGTVVGVWPDEVTPS